MIKVKQLIIKFLKILLKDLTLHVAAANPEFLSRDDVPADQVESEKDILENNL